MKRSVFRPYSSAEGLRSDRSAGDRLRHRTKLRQLIRENIADVIADEAIIGKDRDKVIKVPIRTIKEYRFVYGDNAPGVGQGDGDEQPGQVVGRDKDGKGRPGQAGDQPGVDFYETDITLEELVDIMFEDLELPDMERKILREVEAERASKRKGYQRVGVRSQLDRKRTMRSRVRRKLVKATLQPGARLDAERRFPFVREDMRYRRRKPDIRTESNAAVICIMDTSGSMDTMKKYLARSFFFLLYQFVRTKYRAVDLVFITHHTTAREVTEDEFFHKGESGGTLVSSGYARALEIIEERYHPTLWNVYAFHCSDGDNLEADNPAAVRAAQELCAQCNLFGYGEIKPAGGFSFSRSSLLDVFKEVDMDNFQSILIESKEDIWPRFKEVLAKDRANAAAESK